MSAAEAGNRLQSITATLFGDGFNAAPLRAPPIATGMTESVGKLKEILMKKSAVSQDEYQQVRSFLTLSLTIF